MDSAAIARLLPGIFQSALHPAAAGIVEPDRRLAALLGVMESLQAPVEDVLDGLHHHVDPRRAPPRFVPYLAGWVDLDWLLLATPGQPSATCDAARERHGQPARAGGRSGRDRPVARHRPRTAALPRHRHGHPGVRRRGERDRGSAAPPCRSTSGSSLPGRPRRTVRSSSGSIVAEKPAYATYELVFVAGPGRARLAERKGGSL